MPPYGFLYYKQLQSLFRFCGQIKTVSFDSSRYWRTLEHTSHKCRPHWRGPEHVYSPPRAYVEFWRSSQDTGVLPEVSLSLLLAQQSPSPSMDVSVHPTEKIESSTGLRNIPQLKYARCSSLCVFWSAKMSNSFIPGFFIWQFISCIHVDEIKNIWLQLL